LLLSAANLQQTASHLLDHADRVGCDRAHRAKQKGIRIKSLRFLDSRLRKQVITGGRKRTGIGFRHQWGSGTGEPILWVHDTFSSSGDSSGDLRNLTIEHRQ
jgi:hypothetical protein